MTMLNLMHCVEVVRVRVVNICFEDSEGKWFCYPKSPGTDHVELSKHTATSTATLIDALAMTGEKQSIRLIQTMTMLDKSQMLVAQAKVLNEEEDKVSEVDDWQSYALPWKVRSLVRCLNSWKHRQRSTRHFFRMSLGQITSTRLSSSSICRT